MKTGHLQGADTLLTRTEKATYQGWGKSRVSQGGKPYALLALSAVFLLSCCSWETRMDQFIESIFESMRVNNHLYKQSLAGP